MCGLVYVKRKDGRPAYKAVLKRYRGQKTRGQDGFGYVAIKDNKVVGYHRAPTEHEIVKLLEKEDAPEIMFHHRYPTSTPNVEEAAHPILVENQLLTHQYFVLHNGVIKNTKDLREGHYKLGIPYTTEIMKGFTALKTQKLYHTELAWNDSESLAIETALAMDGLKKTIDTEGAAAVMGVKTNGLNVTDRFFFRNENHPLMYHEDKVMVTVTTLGSGTLVPATSIQRIKEGGGYERYGVMPILAPKGYTYTQPDMRSKNFYEENEWDQTLKRYVPKAKVLPLDREPTFPSNMGFGAGMRRVGEFLLPSTTKVDRDRVGEVPTLQFGEQDELDGRPDDDDVDVVFGIQSLDTIMDELNTIQSRIRKGYDFLDHMTRGVLEAEYENAVEIEDVLKKAIVEMDAVMESMEPTDEMEYQREKISERLVRITDYITRLTNEITIRESMEARMGTGMTG